MDDRVCGNGSNMDEDVERPPSMDDVRRLQDRVVENRQAIIDVCDAFRRYARGEMVVLDGIGKLFEEKDKSQP